MTDIVERLKSADDKILHIEADLNVFELLEDAAAEIIRLREALTKIAMGTLDSEAPYRALGDGPVAVREMQRIARAALAPPKGDGTMSDRDMIERERIHERQVREDFEHALRWIRILARLEPRQPSRGAPCLLFRDHQRTQSPRQACVRRAFVGCVSDRPLCRASPNLLAR